MKKIERKKLDYEIIKDNFLNSKTADILDSLADSYLSNETPDVNFKYKKYRRMLEINELLDLKKKKKVLETMMKQIIKTKNRNKKLTLEREIAKKEEEINEIIKKRKG